MPAYVCSSLAFSESCCCSLLLPWTVESLPYKLSAATKASFRPTQQTPIANPIEPGGPSPVQPSYLMRGLQVLQGSSPAWLDCQRNRESWPARCPHSPKPRFECEANGERDKKNREGCQGPGPDSRGETPRAQEKR